MYIWLLFRQRINVSLDSFFPVKYKDTQLVDTNKDDKAKEDREVKEKRSEERANKDATK